MSLRNFLDLNQFSGNGQFELDGQKFAVAKNFGPHSIHGGLRGYDKVVWTASVGSDVENVVTFSHLDKDGDDNFPGRGKDFISSCDDCK